MVSTIAVMIGVGFFEVKGRVVQIEEFAEEGLLLCMKKIAYERYLEFGTDFHALTSLSEQIRFVANDGDDEGWPNVAVEEEDWELKDLLTIEELEHIGRCKGKTAIGARRSSCGANGFP